LQQNSRLASLAISGAPRILFWRGPRLNMELSIFLAYGQKKFENRNK
jgi:hypothetical protein